MCNIQFSTAIIIVLFVFGFSRTGYSTVKTGGPTLFLRKRVTNSEACAQQLNFTMQTKIRTSTYTCMYITANDKCKCNNDFMCTVVF